MILTLEQYRTLSGDVTSSDAVAQRLLNKYTSAIELYCNQVFGLFTTEETHYAIARDPVLLNRRPVAELTSVTIDGQEVAPTYVHYGLGQVHHSGTWYGKTAVIEYAGGMVAPAMAQEVLVSLIEDALTGAGDSARPVLKETVFGVESVTYGGGEVGSHPILGAYTDLLAPLVYTHVA